MDFKAFATEDFDPINWINNAWQVEGEAGEEQAFLKRKVSELQSLNAQVSSDIDDTVRRAADGGGAVRAGALAGEGAALALVLRGLDARLGGVERASQRTVRPLQRLDRLKGQLERAAATLHEADAWARRAAALRRLLPPHRPRPPSPLTPEFATLVADVRALRAGLRLLADSAHHAQNELELGRALDELEKSVADDALDALANKDESRVRAYVDLGDGMGRREWMWGLWEAAERARVEAAWGGAVEGGGGGAALRALVGALVGGARGALVVAGAWLRHSAAARALLRLYARVLPALRPAPAHVARAHLAHGAPPDRLIERLVDLSADLKNFMSNMKSLLDAESDSVGDVPPAVCEEFGRAVYLPLKCVLPEYKEYQSQVLLASLRAEELERADGLERARALRECVERSGARLQTARALAHRVAGVAGYAHLLPACEAYVAALCSKLSSNLRLLDSEFLQLRAKTDSLNVPTRLFPVILVLMNAARDLVVVLEEFSNSIHEEIEKSQKEKGDPWLEVSVHVAEPVGTERWLQGGMEDAARLAKSARQLGVRLLAEPVAAWAEGAGGAVEGGAALPEWGQAPREHVTRIGQYLLTLPQHLEAWGCGAAEAAALLGDVCASAADRFAGSGGGGAGGHSDADAAYLGSVLEDLGCELPACLRR